MPPTATTYDHGVAWEAAFGVTQGYRVDGTVSISGQFAHDMRGAFVGEGDVEARARQTLENLDRVPAGFGVARSHLAELEILLTNPREHVPPCGVLVKEYLGAHRPAATLVGVTGLGVPAPADRGPRRRAHRLTPL